MSWSLLQNPLHSPHSPKLLTCRHPEAQRMDSTICFSLALSCVPSSLITFLSPGLWAAYAVHAFPCLKSSAHSPSCNAAIWDFLTSQTKFFPFPSFLHFCSASEVLSSPLLSCSIPQVPWCTSFLCSDFASDILVQAGPSLLFLALLKAHLCCDTDRKPVIWCWLPICV